MAEPREGGSDGVGRRRHPERDDERVSGERQGARDQGDGANVAGMGGEGGADLASHVGG